MEKLHSYQGFAGRCHGLRDEIRDKYLIWRENNPNGVVGFVKNSLCGLSESGRENDLGEHEFGENAGGGRDFSHIYR